MRAPYAILDFPGSEGTTRRQLFGRPDAIIAAHAIADVLPALDEVERSTHAGAHAVGFVAYEAAPAFDAALDVRAHTGPAPLLWFGVFHDPPRTVGGPRLHASTGTLPPLEWLPDTERADYDVAIGCVRAAIEAGDVYQVNHTLQLRAACPADGAAALYDALVSERHGTLNGLIETPEWSLVSASPELFVDCADGMLTTRPMKGTLRRGRWATEDDAAAAALAGSAKDRAENLMIVDLLRNDLGRVAEFGSVAVTSMFDVESYPTVHQMTSTITARLRAGLGLGDVFAAMFPCGSVTGAPKVAAMRAIARLERSPRGPYCGAVGVVRPDGSFTFNVAIRTLLLDRGNGTAAFGTGGGITWDSRAEEEFDELTAKAALVTARTPEFRLIETLRLDDVGYARLDGHLHRLAESARYWNFDPGISGAAAAALAAQRERAEAGRTWRVRLTAGRAGDVEVVRTPLAALPGRLEVRPARTPVSRYDRLLFHKTTARDGYDRRRAEQPDAFDVLLWNEEGEVTEFTTGNVVALIDGALVTPPRDAGLLGGVFRQQLLDERRIREVPITLDAIARAERIWYVNSVRGCVRVVLADAKTEKGRIR